MTPEQIAADEAEIKKIKERNLALAVKATEAAQEKINGSYDFSERHNLSSADQKAFTREAQVARNIQDQKAANDISEEIKKAA